MVFFAYGSDVLQADRPSLVFPSLSRPQGAPEFVMQVSLKAEQFVHVALIF